MNQFDSLQERTKNNPFSRAAYTALKWVEYEDKVLRVGERAKEMMSAPGISQAQFVTITLSSWSAIAKLSSTHPLHKCFEETFISDETLDTYFSGIVFVKGRLRCTDSNDPPEVFKPSTMNAKHTLMSIRAHVEALTI